jgi:hypothetical protein
MTKRSPTLPELHTVNLKIDEMKVIVLTRGGLKDKSLK